MIVIIPFSLPASSTLLNLYQVNLRSLTLATSTVCSWICIYPNKRLPTRQWHVFLIPSIPLSSTSCLFGICLVMRLKWQISTCSPINQSSISIQRSYTLGYRILKIEQMPFQKMSHLLVSIEICYWLIVSWSLEALRLHPCCSSCFYRGFTLQPFPKYWFDPVLSYHSLFISQLQFLPCDCDLLSFPPSLHTPSD